MPRGNRRLGEPHRQIATVANLPHNAGQVVAAVARWSGTRLQSGGRPDRLPTEL